MDFVGKTILVVGGSGVLGAELVTQLAGRGAKVLATCSSQESANRIPETAQLKLLLDLRSSESIDVLANYLNQSQQIDGIVLAAGRVGFGRAAETRAEQAAELMQINHLGQANLVNQLLENLLKGNSPFLISITGIVAEKIFPGMSAYSASKKAMSAWLDTIRIENAKSGLFVSEARPGHTETGLAGRPLFGQAPAMPTGMEPVNVITNLMQAFTGRIELVTSF